MHYVLARITVKPEAAAKVHMSTPHVGAAIAGADPLFAAAPEILAYTKLA